MEEAPTELWLFQWVPPSPAHEVETGFLGFRTHHILSLTQVALKILNYKCSTSELL